MRQITTYILKQLALGTVMVTVALLCILWLTQSLRFIELIVSKGASVLAFLQLTGLLLPNFLVYVMPVALFAVVLFTYNRLNSDRELVVMRAAGLGPLAIAWPGLLLALVLTMAGWAMTLFVVPESVRAFREMQWSVRNDVTRLLIREGAFNQVVSGVTVYVRSRSPEGVLEELLVQDSRKPDHPVTLIAERGALVYGESGPQVMMVNGSRQDTERGSGKLSLLYFDRYTLDLKTSKGQNVDDRFRDARERSLKALLTLKEGDEPSLNAVEIRRFRVEAIQRLTTPAGHLTLSLIALSVLFSGSFDRRGSTRKVVVAVALVVLTEALLLGASNLAMRHGGFLPLIPLSMLMPGILGLAVLLRPDVLKQFRLPRRAETP